MQGSKKHQSLGMWHRQTCCTYPRTRPMDRSTSKARAMSSASGFSSPTALNTGLTSSIRSIYAWMCSCQCRDSRDVRDEEHTRTRLTLVREPSSKRARRSSMLISSSRGKDEGDGVAVGHWRSSVGLDKAVKTTEKTYTSLTARLSCISLSRKVDCCR